MTARVGITCGAQDKAVSYSEALRAVKVEPVLLPAGKPHSLDGLAGVLISGGGDVDPALYGEIRQKECGEPDAERDKLEWVLIRAALDADRPLLCVCRGFQILNVTLGGSLYQHIGEQHRQRGVMDVHAVEVAAGTRLAAITGKSSFTVNSRHHQAAHRIAKDLRVSAKAPDGIVEGLEVPGKRFAVAVQWHPEDRIDAAESDRKLFEAFAASLR